MRESYLSVEMQSIYSTALADWVKFNPQMLGEGFHNFPKDIILKVCLIARLEFELIHFEVAVHLFSYYATGIPRGVTEHFVCFSLYNDLFCGDCVCINLLRLLSTLTKFAPALNME